MCFDCGIVKPLYICVTKPNKMNTQQFQTIAIEKMSQFSTTELVEVVKQLFTDFSNGKDMIFDAVISILQNRMNETEFTNLVNSL